MASVIAAVPQWSVAAVAVLSPKGTPLYQLIPEVPLFADGIHLPETHRASTLASLVTNADDLDVPESLMDSRCTIPWLLFTANDVIDVRVVERNAKTSQSTTIGGPLCPPTTSVPSGGTAGPLESCFLDLVMQAHGYRVYALESYSRHRILLLTRGEAPRDKAKHICCFIYDRVSHALCDPFRTFLAPSDGEVLVDLAARRSFVDAVANVIAPFVALPNPS